MAQAAKLPDSPHHRQTEHSDRMFGKKRKKFIEVTNLSSLVARDMNIVGDVLFNGGLRVDGKIEGNVLGSEDEKCLIVLSRDGCIVGRVKAYDAIINGTISGDLEVEHFLELQGNAKVSGNITYRQLQMECGALVEGRLECVEIDGGPERRPADNEEEEMIEIDIDALRGESVGRI